MWNSQFISNLWPNDQIAGGMAKPQCPKSNKSGTPEAVLRFSFERYKRVLQYVTQIKLTYLLTYLPIGIKKSYKYLETKKRLPTIFWNPSWRSPKMLKSVFAGNLGNGGNAEQTAEIWWSTARQEEEEGRQRGKKGRNYNFGKNGSRSAGKKWSLLSRPAGRLRLEIYEEVKIWKIIVFHSRDKRSEGARGEARSSLLS